MMRSFVRLAVSAAVVVFSIPALAQVRIIQTNSGGDNVHIIDPAANKVVAEIRQLPANHGAAASPDGTRLYFSNEGNNTLAVVDVKTLQVVKSIPLGLRPNNITITKDGRKVYVAIAAPPGSVDVIDTVSLTRVKSIPTRGAEHNVYVTPDGKYLVAGSVGGRNMTVIDTATDEPVWSLFQDGVRPIAFDTKPDGSTNRAYVQLSNFHGFVVVDWDQRKEVQRVTLPDVAPEKRNPGPLNAAPAHGIGVAPDGKTLWVCSRLNHHVYVYSLPDLKLVAGIEVGHDPDWITFTPDSKTAYVANAQDSSVSAVDVETRKEVARIPVGRSPKRNITAVLK
jgi:YVTN family beta-propeller protein